MVVQLVGEALAVVSSSHHVGSGSRAVAEGLQRSRLLVELRLAPRNSCARLG
jgi:hypothetical protein